MMTHIKVNFINRSVYVNRENALKRIMLATVLQATVFVCRNKVLTFSARSC